MTRSHTLYKRLIFSFLSTWGLIHAILSLHEHITYYLYLKRWYYESNMETLYLPWSRAVVQHTPIGNTSFALLGVYWILFTYCVRFFYWTVSPILGIMTAYPYVWWLHNITCSIFFRTACTYLCYQKVYGLNFLYGHFVTYPLLYLVNNTVYYILQNKLKNSWYLYG